jgi:hypothetical protein
LGFRRLLSIELFACLLSVGFFFSPAFAFEIIIYDPEILDNLPWLADKNPVIVESPVIIKENKESKNEQNTRPTFGLDHESNQKMVDSGFTINDNPFPIDDNYHTPFAEQTLNIGESNSFQAKIYADKGLRVQEFLFGIPKVGDAHLAELGIEVWFDRTGKIQQVKAIQKSDVVDEDSLVATHEKSKCVFSDIEEKCDLVKVSAVFLEPLRDKVMALKAIDFKNRYQITYLNEGIYLAGDSINPMKTKWIPSKIKGEGLILVTQTSKYSPYWESKEGKVFEMNRFGSFKQVNYEFERFHDDGDVRTRMHSGFGGILEYEKNRAIQIFDSSLLNSKIPNTFAYEYPETSSRIDEKIQQKMLEQEQLAKKILEEENRQARHY